MSIVSRRLDTANLLKYRRVYTAPCAVDDDNNENKPNFEMPATMAGYETITAKSIMRPVDDAPPRRDFVPLKSDQTDSHALGASLFDAPIFGNVNKLTTPEEMRKEKAMREFSSDELRGGRTGVASADYDPAVSSEQVLASLVRGFRAPTRIKESVVAEPTPSLFRQ
jgi:hypothetical protein